MLDLDARIDLEKYPFQVGCMDKKFKRAEPPVVQVPCYLEGCSD